MDIEFQIIEERRGEFFIRAKCGVDERVIAGSYPGREQALEAFAGALSSWLTARIAKANATVPANKRTS